MGLTPGGPPLKGWWTGRAIGAIAGPLSLHRGQVDRGSRPGRDTDAFAVVLGDARSPGTPLGRWVCEAYWVCLGRRRGPSW